MTHWIFKIPNKTLNFFYQNLSTTLQVHPWGSPFYQQSSKNLWTVLYNEQLTINTVQQIILGSSPPPESYQFTKRPNTKHSNLSVRARADAFQNDPERPGPALSRRTSSGAKARRTSEIRETVGSDLLPTGRATALRRAVSGRGAGGGRTNGRTDAAG